VFHRDIKPDNIFIERGRVKIGDFGWAVKSKKTRQTFGGTYMYMAPEQRIEQPYDKSADIFSLGCLLYELLLGKPPFEDVRLEEEMVLAVHVSLGSERISYAA
jgi:serine/threonine protein kinase